MGRKGQLWGKGKGVKREEGEGGGLKEGEGVREG